MAHDKTEEIRKMLESRGLTRRQRHLLKLRMIAAGGESDTCSIQGDDGELERQKLTWECDTIAGKKVPARYRKPLVQTGQVKVGIRELADFSAGGDRFVKLEFAGPTQDVEVFRDTLLHRRKGQHGGLDLPLHGRQIIRDLCEVGGAAFGFVRKTVGAGENGAGGRPVYSFKRYPVEWLQAVHYVTRRTPRARQLAAEIFALPGGPALVDLDPADGAPIFRPPEEPLDDDLLFVRFEFEHDRDSAAYQYGANPEEERIVTRRDFTIDAIVTYKDRVVGSPGEDTTEFWQLAKPIDPHNWGLVPIANAKPDDAPDWALEGTGLVEGPIESLAPANDRSASYLTDAAWTAGDPTIVRLDVRDVQREISLEADELADLDLAGAGEKVLDLISLRDKKGEVKLLELDAAGVEKLEKQKSDTGKAIDRVLGVSSQDRESVKGVMSGIALEILNAPMVARIDTLRGYAARGIADLIRKFSIVLELDGATTGRVELEEHRWPRVFPYTPEDWKSTGEALGVHLSNKTISQETAVNLAATIFGTEDPDEELAKIKKEGKEELEKALAMPPPLNGDPDDPSNEDDDETTGENPNDTNKQQPPPAGGAPPFGGR